jgi:hypothetical protein
MIYNYRLKLSQRLTDAETTRRYFEALDPAHDHDCPPAGEGYEVVIC